MTNVSHQSMHVHVHWVPRTSAFSFIFRNLISKESVANMSIHLWLRGVGEESVK